MGATTQIPTGRLQEIKADFDLKGGWLKMPLEEILFNPRLTGQARQLWGWLSAASSHNAVLLPTWQACELKLNCGVKSRRSCLSQLVQEGLISISPDGSTVTLHDPVEVFQKQRHLMADEICRQCSDLKNEKQETQIEILQLQQEPVREKERIDERQMICEAWNKCKPASYSKILRLSTKQKECVSKHLRNLGLGKEDIPEFIQSVCRGLNRSEFWMRTLDDKTKNFNAVFGYGNPSDTKMKNIEDLYTSGAEADHTEEVKLPVKYTEAQQDLIDQIKGIIYQISMNNPEDDYVQRFFEQRDEQIEQLRRLGVNWEDV